jgi:hypothetical protein
MLLDDSVQYSGYLFYPMRGTRRADYLYRNGSALYVTGGSATQGNIIFDNGPSTLTFSNSVLARKTGLASAAILPVKIANESNWTNHEVRLRDGSTLYSNWLTNKYATAATVLTVGFDNSEWKPFQLGETGDFVFDFPPYETVRFEMEGRGAILAPADGRTFTVVSPFVGEGGMRKQGAGTLAFACKDGMKSWAFSGTLSIEEGAATAAPGSMKDGADVSMAAGTSLDLLGGTAQGMVVSGAGTLANGTLAAPTLKLDVPNDPSETAVPTIAADVAVTGRLTIDVGRTAQRPLAVGVVLPVAVWASGTDPSKLDVRIANTGSNANRGTLFLVGDVLYCRLTRRGFSISIK